MTETASKPGPTEVWITGIGLATSLGEGLDANWAALQEKRINVDEKGFAPYIVHPLMPVTYDSQIPKKGDQRQMEAWQRIGVYAAGLALDSAGIKGNKDILSKIDMVAAAGGGERDLNVDTGVLTAEAKGANAPGFLNERLMSDLRPTLFLAQLSNLLAGNIAIVHGIGGTSRTFMGEEVAGADAARIALARIASGESDIALIGGSHNGERKDLMVLYEFGDFNLKDKFAPVWARKGSRRLRARLGRRVSGAGIEGACGSAWRKAVRKAVERRCGPRPPQAARRHGRDAGEALGEAAEARRQGRDHIRRDRRGARHERRARLPEGPRRLPGALDWHDVRPHHGNAIPARPCTRGAVDLARRAVSAERFDRDRD
ncbi:hypothetical protein ACVWWP_005624 [Bradyrhizobium sp. LM3.6]